MVIIGIIEETENGTEGIFEVIMAEIIPKLMTGTKIISQKLTENKAGEI